MGYHRGDPMLDLKAKLASAGLVTDEDIKRVEKSKRGKGKPKAKGRGRGKGKGPGGLPQTKASHQLKVAAVKAMKRGEAYGEVRRWVERVRMDAPGKTPSDDAKTFHFATAAGPVGRLVVEPDVHGWLGDGSAAVVAYMSNHGLAHAVVPAAAGRDLVAVFPLWLRFLVGDERAGQLERDQPAAQTATDAT